MKPVLSDSSRPGKFAWLLLPLFPALLLLLGGCGGDNPPAPLPQISSFSTAQDVVTAGGGTTLTAVFSNGTGSIDQGIGPVQSGSSVPTGTLTADRTFTLTVTNSDKKTATWSLTVRAVVAPQISSFTATPEIVAPGQASSLAWMATGAATATVDHGVGAISGKTQVQVTPSATTTYQLTVANAAGATVTATATVSVVIAGLPRIRVDYSGETGVFRDPDGHRFIPRGANYIRLASNYPNTHANFGSGIYNSAQVEAALTTLEHYGYNVVRVFIDPRPDDITVAEPISPSYMNNFADFLLRATRHHLYLMPTFDCLPDEKYYTDQTLPADPNITGNNNYALHGPHVLARKAYIEDFIDALEVRVGARLVSTIFVYSLWNEFYYDTGSLPFSSTSISVTTANGQTYSMAEAAQRQQAADDNAVYFSNVLADAIHASDPGSLVTVGAWSNAASDYTRPVGLPPTGWAYPVRILALANSSHLDLLDQHIYPLGASYSFEADLQSIEWSSLPPSMPVIMGETAAFKKYFASPAIAAQVVKDLEISAWKRGFAGFLFWSYDGTEQPELWNMLDGDAAILKAIAPINLPDLDSPVTVKPMTFPERVQFPMGVSSRQKPTDRPASHLN
jgi:hypothetical protein